MERTNAPLERRVAETRADVESMVCEARGVGSISELMEKRKSAKVEAVEPSDDFDVSVARRFI